jgi:hypothetical protein
MIEPKPIGSHLKPIFYVLFFLFATSSCRPYIQETQPQTSKQYPLTEGNGIGQTFVAGFAGLEGFQVLLSPGESGDGNIVMHLRNEAGSTSDLVTVSLPIEDVKAAGYYNFNYTPISGSNRQYYYVLFEIQGSGEVFFTAGPGDSYLQGALYQNNEAVDAQLNFRLSYDLGRAAFGLIQLAFYWVGILLAGVLLFVLPGWAILTIVFPAASSLPWGARLGIASALAISIYPILFLWTNLVGIRLGSLYAFGPIFLGLVWLIWNNVQIFNKRREAAFRPWLQRIQVSDVTLLFVIGFIILTRFWAVRSLDAPMFGDSYQHTVIAQLLVDNNGLFNSWHPYSELETFTYHFGFHTLSAVFHWLTKIDLAGSTIWTGQILNVLAVLGLYPLALKIGKSRWAGVVAVFVAGLVSPMPMVYTNWGRYTQLTGQIIMLGAVYLAWQALEKGKPNWKLIGLVAFALGSLALTHYRILVYAVLFFPAIFLVMGRKTNIKLFVQTIAGVGFMAGLLFLPWFIRVFGGEILALFKAQLATPAQNASSWVGENPIGNLFDYLPPLLWLLQPIIIGWGLWNRKIGAAVIALWWYLILLATNPNWLNLPGAGALTNFTYFIAAYIPTAILVGSAFGWIVEIGENSAEDPHLVTVKKARFNKAVYKVGASSLVLLLFLPFGTWSSRQRIGDMSISYHSMVARPDLRAASWIRENTTPESIFLVNTMFAYGDSLVVGTDGGWWLPLIAERKTILPPLVYGTEKGPRGDYISWVNSLPHVINDKGICSPDLQPILKERGVTHVYIGQQQGRVNSPNSSFTPDELLNCGYYQKIYHQDRVWVFAVREKQ